MYVKNHMLTKDKLTVVYLDEDMRSALKKIDEGDFLSLPVFDRNNFKGILMKEAIYRYYYDSDFCGNKSKFLDDVKVKDIYSINFKSIRENEPIEDASYLLNELRTPFLPVFDARNNFVGILTHKAIFDAFSEMFGLGEGTRITVNLLDVPGQLAKLTEIIRKENVNILNIAVMDAKIMDVYKVVIRINTKDVENIIEKIEKSGFKVEDVSK
ncbi:CBS domain-containing protein [Sporanaerobacter sp. PP17-6a]|uniref:CBS domain-containing protein n=1 Tax=Sporanaerobacter sp. PP17-6a TaxID=1891289 RepID=UPI00089FF2C4|nr:CBS domain-containing protein [Sporanaerobacter sp. PP17-6a]MBE6083340.1 CBS domain-containing protein [Tissierellaceae bacterium]SCL95627.1 putative manganese-dependent inorganic pyrophosphatase [Sporanaerobacter sp. PP17-6a]